jgi:hypothetical protein
VGVLEPEQVGWLKPARGGAQSRAGLRPAVARISLSGPRILA